jgi:GNAT superfamily N-acetyltransferase
MSDEKQRQALLARIAGRYEMGPAKDEDVGEVARLFKEVFDIASDQEQLERRFSYRYRENPNASGYDGLWTCRSRGKLIGISGMVDTTVWDAGHAVRGAYCADLAVRTPHRGFGVPHAMQQAMNERRDIVMEGNLNAPARAMVEATGGRAVEGCRVLRRWLRPTDLLRRGARAGVVKRVRQRDERLDGLWARARQAGPLIALRDAATLEWRFLRNPFKRYELFALMDGDSFSGYVVTHLENFKGPAKRLMVVDSLFAPSTSAKAKRVLLHAVLARAARRGAVVADVMTSLVEEQQFFEGLGFRAKDFDPGFLVYATPYLAARPELWTAASWHLTFADSDFYL